MAPDSPPYFSLLRQDHALIPLLTTLTIMIDQESLEPQWFCAPGVQMCAAVHSFYVDAGYLNPGTHHLPSPGSHLALPHFQYLRVYSIHLYLRTRSFSEEGPSTA